MSIKLENVILAHHPISTRTADMRNFLAPLKENCCITHFSYERLYPNKRILLLTTHPEVSDLFIRNKYYEFAYCGNHEEYRTSNYLTDALPPNEFHQLSRENFNLSHGLIMVKKFEGFSEICYFNSTRENYSINNFYMNHLDLLESFISDFKLRYNKEINHAMLHKIKYPDHSRDIFLLNPENNLENSWSHRTITSLTPAEDKCLRLLQKGLTAKHIGRKINRSPRTVEKHLDSVRKKYGVKTRLELLSVM